MTDGKKPNTLRVIHNGINIKKYLSTTAIDIKKTLAIKKEQFLMACVGSLIHRKGIDIIINTLSILHRQGVPVYLVIIGEGDQRPQLEAQVNTLGLAQYVFWGESSNPHALLKGGIDVLISAAREEAFGLVFAEAGLAKIPVIASTLAAFQKWFNIMKPDGYLSLRIAIIYVKPFLNVLTTPRKENNWVTMLFR